jgi:hypothetical protein
MLRILGLLFVAILVVAGMGFGYWVHQDRQARAFVVATIPVVYKSWNAEAMVQRSIIELRTPAFEGQVRDMLQNFGTHLGPLESADDPEGSLQYGQLKPGLPSGLFGKYSSKATFTGGEGELEFTVIKEEGVWRIARFSVSSPKLLEAVQRQQAMKAARPNYVPGPPDEEAAVLALADEIFRILDSEDPGSAWNRGSIPFQQAKTKRRFVADMKRLHDMSGHAQSRKLQGVGFAFDKAGANPPGDYAVADYVSTYSRVTVRERLGFYRREGKWQFSGHDWSRTH